MKRLRFTPLNLLSALLLTGTAYLWIFPDEGGWRKLGSIPLLAMLVLCLLSDIFFRFLLKDLKRIWIVEGLFLIFVLLLIIVIQGI